MVVEMDRKAPQPLKDPSSSAASMSSATLTSPPIATARLVVDTDVASFIFKWLPNFAPRYVDIVRGSELIVSFMTLAEMRQGALDANWGDPETPDHHSAPLNSFR